MTTQPTTQTPTRLYGITRVMPLPRTQFDQVVRSVSALRRSYPHLYQDGDWKGPLVWERIWDTTNNQYGRFQHIATKPLPPNGRLYALWEAREWRTSYADYGEQIVKPTQRSTLNSQVLATEGAKDTSRKSQPCQITRAPGHRVPIPREIPGHRVLPPIGKR